MGSKESLIDIMKDYSDLKHLESLVLQYRSWLMNLMDAKYIEEVIKSPTWRVQLLKDFDKHFGIVNHKEGIITANDLDEK